jgi:hypothetical protein
MPSLIVRAGGNAEKRFLGLYARTAEISGDRNNP